MSDTPRTDNAAGDGTTVPADFAADLEREVNAMTARAEKAEAEREAMKLDGWRQCAKGQRTTQFCGQVQAAVEAEREACAKVCGELADSPANSEQYRMGANWARELIRARGEK